MLTKYNKRLRVIAMAKYLIVSQAQQQLPELSAQLIEQPVIITQDGKSVMVAFGLEQLEKV